MQVILLEKLKIGNIGAVITVKNGYARNYLLPRKKAIRATKPNLEYFEQQRAELEKQNDEKKAFAEKLSEKVQGTTVVLIRQAGDDGRLYGSVTARDIVRALSDKIGAEIESECVVLSRKVKEIGLYNIEIALHSEVLSTISLNIARTDDEAKVAETVSSQPSPVASNQGDV